MIKLLQGWKGAVEVNGQRFDSVAQLLASDTPMTDTIHIKLCPAVDTGVNEAKKGHSEPAGGEVVVTVKKYMTQPSTPEFDFMAKWNNDNPMPLRTMVGRRVKETPGMVYMELHGDIIAEKTTTCMCCGRKLTNPVSQYFGIGPECGHHNYVNPFDTDEELQEAVSQYRKQLQNITWTGWVIKSAIAKEEPVDIN